MLLLNRRMDMVHEALRFSTHGLQGVFRVYKVYLIRAQGKHILWNYIYIYIYFGYSQVHFHLVIFLSQISLNKTFVLQ